MIKFRISTGAAGPERSHSPVRLVQSEEKNTLTLVYSLGGNIVSDSSYSPSMYRRNFLPTVFTATLILLVAENVFDTEIKSPFAEW